MQKCIWCKNAFLQRKTKCTHQMHFCIKCCVWCFFTFCVAYIFLCKNAVFFALQKTKMLNIFFWKMYAKTYLMQKYIWCKNVFDAKIYLMQKCIWCKNIFDAKMYLMQKCLFAKQRNAPVKCTHCLCFLLCLVFLLFAKMHLMQKCCVFCFAKNKDAALTFCWCWTFSFGKCSATLCKNAFDAEHFPLENVMQKCIFAQPNAFCRFLTFWFALRCQNAFWHQMHFCIKCIFAPTKCKGSIFVFCKAKNTAFDAKMHFCNAYIFLWKMFSVHFPKKNVQHHIWLCKMFSITFDFVKCSASHFPKENVQHLCFLQNKKHSIFAKSNVRNAKSNVQHDWNKNVRSKKQRKIFFITIYKLQDSGRS